MIRWSLIIRRGKAEKIDSAVAELESSDRKKKSCYRTKYTPRSERSFIQNYMNNKVFSERKRSTR